MATTIDNSLLNEANLRGTCDQGHLEKTLLHAYQNSRLDKSVDELRQSLQNDPIFSRLKDFAIDNKKALKIAKIDYENENERKEFVENVFINLSLKPKLLAKAINEQIIDMEKAMACFASMLEHQKKDGERACFSFLTKIDTASNNNSIDKQKVQFASQLPETFMQFVPQSTSENVRWIVAILNIMNRMQMMEIDIEAGAYQRIDNRLSKLLEIHNMAKRSDSKEPLEESSLNVGAVNPEDQHIEASIDDTPEAQHVVRVR